MPSMYMLLAHLAAIRQGGQGPRQSAQLGQLPRLDPCHPCQPQLHPFPEESASRSRRLVCLGFIRSRSHAAVPDCFQSLCTSLAFRALQPRMPKGAGVLKRILQSGRSDLVPESDVAMCKAFAGALPASHVNEARGLPEAWVKLMPRETRESTDQAQEKVHEWGLRP